jgi:hypothetical protein
MLKESLNKSLYEIHLQAANEWSSSWYMIQESIHETLNQECECRYKLLDDKLRKFTQIQEQEVGTYTNAEFYPRVVNKTDTKFTNEEINLLNKGFNYNLHYKHKHWLMNLACEAQNAVKMLPQSEQQ